MSDVVSNLVALVIVAVVYGIWSSASCSAQWEKSGLTSDWGPIKGCTVHLRDGRWLPADRVREIDITPQEKPKALPPT